MQQVGIEAHNPRVERKLKRASFARSPPALKD
jgi:hypothetical protein